MLLKIAWRNIWRNRTRSLLVIGAVMLGIMALVFMAGWVYGIVNSYIDNAIQTQTSHLQIHHPEFNKTQKGKYYLEGVDEMLQTIEATASVSSVVAVRSLINGTIVSPRATRPVFIKAVDPAMEKIVTQFDTKVETGHYLDSDKKRPILISEKLAEKLKVKIGKKVVLNFTDKAGELTGLNFKIVGFYNTGNSKVDELFIYVRSSDLNPKFGFKNQAHEIAILLNDIEAVDTVQSELAAVFPNYEITNYQQISPMISLYKTQIGVSVTIIVVIIMIALIFGIINTMLMAVLERTKELGMLMAVGMNKTKVFLMIMLETLLLSLVGVPLGLLFGHIIVVIFGHTGIDLSSYQESLDDFGINSIIYTSPQPDFYVSIIIAVLITAFIASIFPSLRAIRLRPVEAIRKI